MVYQELDELRKHSKHIDHLAGVYLLWLNDELVYVGQSINGTSRIMDHRKDKVYNRYTWISVSLEELDDIERFFIKKYRPKYNVSNPRYSLKVVAKFFGMSPTNMLEYTKTTPVKRTQVETIRDHPDKNKKRVVIKYEDMTIEQRVNNRVNKVASNAIKKAYTSKRPNVKTTKKKGRRFKRIKSGHYN